jgi:uncharacterized protein (TIGR02145 family)
MKESMKHSIIILASITLLLTSCVGEKLKVGAYGLLCLSVSSTDGQEYSLSTRALSENAIHDLHILVYDASGNLVARRYFGNILSTYEVPLPEGTGYTVYAIANTGNADAFTEANAGTVDDLMALTTTISTWNAISSRSDMLMSGKSGDGAINIIRTVKDNPCTITLKRLAAKITLNISVESGQYVSLQSYSIMNLPTMSYYIAHPLTTEEVDYKDAGGNLVEEDANGVAGTDATPAGGSWLDVDGLTSTSLTFYMYENRRGVNTGITSQIDKSASKAPANATYVEIYGKTYQNDGVWRVYLGALNTSNFNIKRNGHYTYDITLKPTVVDTRVTWTSTPAGGSGTTSLKPANSFIIPATAGSYTFDASVKGNGRVPFGMSGKVSAGITPSTSYSAFVIWSMGGAANGATDVVSSVTYDTTTGAISFSSPNGANGNALIGLKDNNTGKLLWSWHVWKTDYNPASDYDLYYKNAVRTDYLATQTPFPLKMMKINLGASFAYAANQNITTTGMQGREAQIPAGALGLFYQWGRKDPFIGASNWNTGIRDWLDNSLRLTSYNASSYAWTKIAVQNTGADKYASLQYAIEHPTCFITDGTHSITGGDHMEDTGGDGSPYDWMRVTGVSDQIDDLWGNPGPPTGWIRPNPTFGEKSIYDPCPNGWRVPPQDTWMVFCDRNSGGNGSTNWNISDPGTYDTVGGVNGWLYYTQSNKQGSLTYIPPLGRIDCDATFYSDNTHLWSSSELTRAGDYGDVGFFIANSNFMNTTSDYWRAAGIPVRCCEDK